jgi:hypothetical protein
VGLTNMDVTKEMVEVGIPGVMGLVKTTSAYRESNKLCNVRSVWPGPWGEGHRAIVARVDGAAGVSREPHGKIGREWGRTAARKHRGW